MPTNPRLSNLQLINIRILIVCSSALDLAGGNCPAYLMYSLSIHSQLPTPNFSTDHLKLRTILSLMDFNSGLESLAKLGHMSNRENTSKVSRNRINCGN